VPPTNFAALCPKVFPGSTRLISRRRTFTENRHEQ